MAIEEFSTAITRGWPRLSGRVNAIRRQFELRELTALDAFGSLQDLIA
jgi:hypothetical protein